MRCYWAHDEDSLCSGPPTWRTTLIHPSFEKRIVGCDHHKDESDRREDALDLHEDDRFEWHTIEMRGEEPRWAGNYG